MSAAKRKEEAKHTPGPWEVGGPVLRGRVFEVFAKHRNGVYTIADVAEIDGADQDTANAHLIAAAPDTTELLAEHLRWYEGDTSIDEDSLIERTRAALKKAGVA